MAVYTHSETFASLKNIKEEVQGQLTTAQWLQTLDYFIESAIDPIVTVNPDLADNYYAKVIAWQSHKPSIKFSRNDKNILPIMLFNSVTTEGKEKREHQKSMLLNRGLLFGLISVFQKTVNKKMYEPGGKKNRIKKWMYINSHHPNTYAAYNQCRYYASKAYWFKELIMQKYTRLALMSAKKTYKVVNYIQKLDDIVQTYLIFLSRAIDRCDSRQGVLTTFIQTWFYSARTEIQKGCAESLHTSYEELLETGMPIQYVDADYSFEEIQHIAYEAKKIDPVGVFRFSVGIPDHYSKADLRKLELFTKENNVRS